ncbi:MAG: hypothetical protein NZ777_14680 [Pseudomonadales bacterium]|nr:hypothetical protein [Pseudomonadales bacterium]
MGQQPGTLVVARPGHDHQQHSGTHQYRRHLASTVNPGGLGGEVDALSLPIQVIPRTSLYHIPNRPGKSTQLLDFICIRIAPVQFRLGGHTQTLIMLLIPRIDPDNDTAFFILPIDLAVRVVFNHLGTDRNSNR